jgi:hypothetical protein
MIFTLLSFLANDVSIKIEDEKNMWCILTLYDSYYWNLFRCVGWGWGWGWGWGKLVSWSRSWSYGSWVSSPENNIFDVEIPLNLSRSQTINNSYNYVQCYNLKCKQERTIQRNWQHWAHKTQDDKTKPKLQHRNLKRQALRIPPKSWLNVAE